MKTVCNVLVFLALLVLCIGSWFSLNVGKMYAGDYLLIAVTLMCISYMFRPEENVDGQDSNKESTLPGV